MSSNCPHPQQPNPSRGESTGNDLPPNTFAGKPLPYIASTVVPIIYGTGPYFSSQYTDALQQGNLYVSMSTIAGSNQPTFTSQEDRIKYLKGQLFFRPTC